MPVTPPNWSQMGERERAETLEQERQDTARGPLYEQSFSGGEIQALDYIIQALLRGDTPTMVTRHKDFASLCRKVIALKSAAKGTA